MKKIVDDVANLDLGHLRSAQYPLTCCFFLQNHSRNSFHLCRKIFLRSASPHSSRSRCGRWTDSSAPGFHIIWNFPILFEFLISTLYHLDFLDGLFSLIFFIHALISICVILCFWCDTLHHLLWKKSNGSPVIKDFWRIFSDFRSVFFP